MTFTARIGPYGLADPNCARSSSDDIGSCAVSDEFFSNEASRSAPAISSVDNVPDQNGSFTNSYAFSDCTNIPPSHLDIQGRVSPEMGIGSSKCAAFRDDVDNSMDLSTSSVCKRPMRSRDQEPDVPPEPCPVPAPSQDPGHETSAEFANKRRRLLSTPTMAFISRLVAHQTVDKLLI